MNEHDADAIPRIMQNGVWIFWDAYVTPTPAERLRHALWVLAMEATYRIDPSVLFYVEALEPKLTPPPTKRFRLRHDECGLEEIPDETITFRVPD